MKIIYENEEGGVSIITPIINDEVGLTIEEIAAKDVPEDTPFEIVEDDVIPTERTFRNAWVKDGEKVSVDMPKARVIRMDCIRLVRNKELDDSDKEIVRAVEDEIDLTPLKTKRQELRDIPQDFDLSVFTTPQALKNAWPVNLKKENSL